MTSRIPHISLHIGIAAVLCTLAAPALAHGDEDHSQDKPPAAAAARPATAASGAFTREPPQRLPDGTLFMPKHVQRQLEVRTQQVAGEALAATVELNGRVIVDPGSGGRVQATQAGTVVPAGSAFPALGQRVRKGAVLALLRPVASSLERGDRAARQAELAGQRALAERRVARLEQLEGSVPAKEVEAARAELHALDAQLAALAGSVDAHQPLRSPVDGILSAVHVVAGEVVDANAVLFEVVDPSRLWVEAPAYDLALAATAAAAQGLAGDTPVRLQLAGAGRQLREQALPMRFKVVSSAAPLAVGQPVRVLLQTRGAGPGIAVPRSALARNAAGQTVVWVHHEPELFTARQVRQEPLDATRVVVREGLKPGERVVTQGATLLSQVR